MIPLFCILIHSGAPSDTKLFDNILKELSRRRIIKKKRTYYILDRGYYSNKNLPNRNLTNNKNRSIYIFKNIHSVFKKLKRTNILSIRSI